MDYLAAPAWLARLLQVWHLRHTRLGRMLQRRGVEPAEYARATPFVEVETQIADCHSCVCQPLCDRALGSRAPSRSNYSFCPNHEAILQFSRRDARRGGRERG
jgi:hypothetical protein